MILFPLFSLESLSQKVENPIESLKGKRDFIYGIDNRRTHIQGQSTIIYGGYLGIGFDDVLRFKIGISGTPFDVGRTQNELGVVTRHRLVFLTLGEEFDFFVRGRFRITTYLQAGLGFDYTSFQFPDGTSSQNPRRTIIPLEFGFHANYDLYPWLRAKLGVGWRFVLPQESRDLSGYYLKIGFGFSWPKFRAIYCNKEKQL